MSVISLKRGDTLELKFEWKNRNGSPVDLTGCSARFQARDKNGSLVLNATSDAGHITFEPENGVVNIFYKQTDSLPIEEHRCDLELTFSNGAVRSSKTFILKVIEDITR